MSQDDELGITINLDTSKLDDLAITRVSSKFEVTVAVDTERMRPTFDEIRETVRAMRIQFPMTCFCMMLCTSRITGDDHHYYCTQCGRRYRAVDVNSIPAGGDDRG